jgi:hypothetical protein
VSRTAGRHRRINLTRLRLLGPYLVVRGLSRILPGCPACRRSRGTRSRTGCDSRSAANRVCSMKTEPADTGQRAYPGRRVDWFDLSA